MKRIKEKEKQSEQPRYVSDLEAASLDLMQTLDQTKHRAEEFYPMIPTMEDLSSVEQKADSLKRAIANLTQVVERTVALVDELSARCRDVEAERKKRKLLPSAPANTTIDLEETATQHFSKGLGIYKLLLVCFIGSFAGVVVEMMWCLITNGYLESRAGLVYGPFNLLYGAGAVVLTVCLYRFRNRGAWISFLGGMLVGSVVEYLCSWGQEMLFGSRSWDYSHMPFNINGRICLLYSVFWGFLGVLWIKNLYPRMAQLILKIPNKSGKIATWVLTVFFLFNSVMSLAAVGRWAERVNSIPASNQFELFLDDHFPDQRMETIYANMDFGDGS